MALISSSNLIRSLCIFHFVISYYLLSSPATLAKQGLVFVLSGSMQLNTPNIPLPSTTTSLAAIFLILLSLSDFTACSELLLPADAHNALWSAQAQVRLLFLFTLSAWIYLTKGGEPGGFGDKARNGLVFTWAFLETVGWFWIFLTLRDERREIAARGQRSRRGD